MSSSCQHVCHHLPRHEFLQYDDLGVHQLQCHGVTVNPVESPGSYDQGGIGGPDRLGS